MPRKIICAICEMKRWRKDAGFTMSADCSDKSFGALLMFLPSKWIPLLETLGGKNIFICRDCWLAGNKWKNGTIQLGDTKEYPML